jgi:hypothetical protein
MATYTIYAPLGAGLDTLAVSAPYITQSDVEVVTRPHTTVFTAEFTGTVLTPDVDYTWTSSSTIQLATPSDGSTDYLVRRSTQRDPLAAQQPGVLSSARINLDFSQRQYVDEEQDDRLTSAYAVMATLATRLAALEGGIAVTGYDCLATASEDIVAGNMLNLYWSAGALMVRKALASDAARWANAHTAASFLSGTQGPITALGLNSAVAVAALGEAYLSDSVAGAYTLTAPSASGSFIQPLGLAVPGYGLFFSPQPRILL